MDKLPTNWKVKDILDDYNKDKSKYVSYSIPIINKRICRGAYLKIDLDNVKIQEKTITVEIKVSFYEAKDINESGNVYTSNRYYKELIIPSTAKGNVRDIAVKEATTICKIFLEDYLSEYTKFCITNLKNL